MRKKCPLIVKFNSLKAHNIKEGEIEKPTPPSAFVGRAGYPAVFVGPMISIQSEHPEHLDAPWMWEGSIEDIIGFRMSLLRGMRRTAVEAASNPDRFLLNIQEATASEKPVELGAEVSEIIRRPLLDDIIQPVGISAKMDRIELSGNPKIPHKVEKAYYDDLRAVEAVKSLFDAGFSTYYIQKIFSVGMLGIQRNRKLVPTRWSITAVHDILGEQIKEEIALFPELDEVQLYSYEHFGNHFEVILSPGEYSFQLVEIWIEKSFWSPDRTWIGFDSEEILPKKDYSPLSGGYYAARLPILEHLRKVKRKAKVTVLREIKPDYYAPLGVWVVEEGVRRAMRGNCRKFENLSDALKDASSRLITPKEKWEINLRKNIQTTLSGFL
jgi:hypothetical protein